MTGNNLYLIACIINVFSVFRIYESIINHDTYYRHIVLDKILQAYFSHPDLLTNNFLWLLSRIYHNLSKSRGCYIVLKDTRWHFSYRSVLIYIFYRDNSLLNELLHHCVVTASEWFIRYIYIWNIPFINNALYLI